MAAKGRDRPGRPGPLSDPAGERAASDQKVSFFTTLWTTSSVLGAGK
jgi:hypothetical protein